MALSRSLIMIRSSWQPKSIKTFITLCKLLSPKIPSEAEGILSSERLTLDKPPKEKSLLLEDHHHLNLVFAPSLFSKNPLSHPVTEMLGRLLSTEG